MGGANQENPRDEKRKNAPLCCILNLGKALVEDSGILGNDKNAPLGNALKAWEAAKSHSVTRSLMSWRVNLMQLFARDHSRAELLNMGFEGLGRRSYEAARKFANAGGGYFEYEVSSGGHAKGAKGQVVEIFTKASKPCRVGYRGNPTKRSIQGPKAGLVSDIIEANICSRSYAYKVRYCPMSQNTPSFSSILTTFGNFSIRDSTLRARPGRAGSLLWGTDFHFVCWVRGGSRWRPGTSPAQRNRTICVACVNPYIECGRKSSSSGTDSCLAMTRSRPRNLRAPSHRKQRATARSPKRGRG